MKTATMKILGCIAATFMLLLGPMGSAQAVLMMSLDDGNGNSVLINDGDADGIVGFIGPVGPDWVTNVAGGLSKPFLGGPNLAHMDLSDQSGSTGFGTLTIELTDTDFAGPLGNALMDIGGTLGGGIGGSVTYNAWYSTNNNPFEKLALIDTLAFATPGAFSDSTSASGPGLAPYSLTLQVVIVHDGDASTNQVSSFDAELRVVPEPASIALLGFGLLGLGVANRRRIRKS